MTKQELQDLFQKGPIILDGATGSNLMAKGMPMGVCPEDWIYHHKDAIVSLQKAYVEAGTQILYAPTFTANRIKLAEYDMEDRLEELNRAMVRYSREAAGDRAFVAGDLTMTGRQLYPVGDLMFEDLVDVYKEQVRAILKEGVDLFVIETMMSLQECRAALLAVKETCDLPVMISLTYNEDGRTLYGTSPEIAMVVLEHMGADIVGVNCSTGPLAMIPLVKATLPYADIPIMVKPNAGMPELENGETVYNPGGVCGCLRTISRCRSIGRGWLLWYQTGSYQGAGRPYAWQESGADPKEEQTGADLGAWLCGGDAGRWL